MVLPGAATPSFMASLPFQPETLLEPLSADAPCGPDMVYEPPFAALELAGAGKPERQYGDKVYPAEPPDWVAVHEGALALAASTRDLRLAVWLLRSACRLHGLAGAVAGLQLLDGLLSRHWDHVHPQLDASDNNNPLLRLSALSPLTPQESPYPGPALVQGDLREARLIAGDRNSPLVRDIELGLRAAEPLAGELVPTEAGIVSAVSAQLARHPELAGQMQAGLQAIDSIVATLGAKLPAADIPDLTQVRKLLATIARAAQRAQGGATQDEPGSAASATAGSVSAQAPVATPGAINNREDVARTIDRLCDWLERNEPSHPAPLLLRRAQRLMNKNFLEIIRDMAPDGTDQVVRLAGRPDNE